MTHTSSSATYSTRTITTRILLTCNTKRAARHALSNPISLLDPTGRCPQPPTSSGKTICVDLFIQAPFIILGTGYGDGRGFDSNSAPQKSRGYVYIYLDNNGKMRGAPMPHINPSCVVLVGCFGPYPQYNHFDVSQDSSNGNLHVTWQLLNGVSGAFRATGDQLCNESNTYGDPSGNIAGSGSAAKLISNAIPEINGTMTLHRNINGTYSVIALDRDPYPSLEVYYYLPGQPTQMIMQHRELEGGPMVGLNPLTPNDTDLSPTQPDFWEEYQQMAPQGA